MKYIRTKDGIYDKEKCCVESQVVKFFNEWFSITNQADTIEELCDAFIILFISGEIAFEKHFEWLNNYAEFIAIYGTILTDKGLIFVAKVNDKGELELL